MRTVFELLIELLSDAEVGYNNLGESLKAAVGAIHIGDEKAAAYFLSEAFDIACSWARTSRPGSREDYLYRSVVVVLDGCLTHVRVGAYPFDFADKLSQMQEKQFGPFHRRLAWYTARRDGYDYRF
ncbi:MAG: hypothetical protein QXN56_06965 [Candidatus Hadarchaeum sp.]